MSIVGGSSVVEEEGREERPVNVQARKGRRERAHVGPCSWIVALGWKYLSRVSEGGRPEMKEERKEWAVWIRRDVSVFAVVVEGRGGGMVWLVSGFQGLR